MPYRYHKSKPVREATLETIKLLKETGYPLLEADLAKLEDRPLKSARGSSNGHRSPGPIVPAASARADSRERSIPSKRDEMRSSRTELISSRRNEPANMKRPESR